MALPTAIIAYHSRGSCWTVTIDGKQTEHATLPEALLRVSDESSVMLGAPVQADKIAGGAG